MNVTCAQLSKARNWEKAYRDAELACGADIPNPPSTQENTPSPSGDTKKNQPQSQSISPENLIIFNAYKAEYGKTLGEIQEILPALEKEVNSQQIAPAGHNNPPEEDNLSLSIIKSLVEQNQKLQQDRESTHNKSDAQFDTAELRNIIRDELKPVNDSLNLLKDVQPNADGKKAINTQLTKFQKYKKSFPQKINSLFAYGATFIKKLADILEAIEKAFGVLKRMADMLPF